MGKIIVSFDPMVDGTRIHESWKLIQPTCSMIPSVLLNCLNLGPAKRAILRVERHPGMEKLLEKFSGVGRVFGSIEEAREAILSYRPDTSGHFDDNLIGSNFSLSSAIRMSDYPVLFWLLDILRTEEVSLFDFGGGVGQTFVNYSRLLPEDRLRRWIVQDLSDVVSQAAEKFFTDGLPHRLEFTGKMADGSGCNVVLAAGAFHYWEGSIADFFEAIGGKPSHFIVNRSPMRSHGKAFFTVQQGQDWAVPCQVRSVEYLKTELEAEGYSLVDSWIDLQKTLTLPLLPAYSCPYRGLYFRREIQ